MNDPMTLKRPKPGDGEEELFRMQEEFMQSQQEPSAKVINLGSQNRHIHQQQPLKIRSKFAERQAMRESRLSTFHSSGDVINPEVLEQKVQVGDRLDSVQSHLPSTIILGNIIEKKFHSPPTSITTAVLPEPSRGFPDVFFLSKKFKIENSSSLFRQNIKSPLNNQQSGSILVQDFLGSDIHKENLEKLKQMPLDEILDEKSKLETLLSPDLIKFIKARKNSSIQLKSSIKPSEPPTASTSTFSKTNENEEIIKMKTMDETPATNPPLAVSEILQQASDNHWIHMDDLETPKLEWMKDLELSKSESSTEEPYNARFSFDGLLLPFKDETISINQGLHHHGEESDRPGYSLQELLQLTRSSIQQQRCTALTTLGNIMEKSRKGLYDKVLDPPPLSALNSRNILLLLRFSLDDTSVAVVTASLQALRSFLYSEADEICLDRLYGWRYNDGMCAIPQLLPPKTDVSDVSSLKDHELAQLDCISAAVRSDIFVRLRYILSEMQPTPIGVSAALEIFIRIARHSKLTALNVAYTHNLLDIIIKHFVPLTTDRLMNLDDLKTAYGVPNVTALRLLRILVEYGGRPVAERLYNLKIMNRLLSYVTSNPGEAGIRLSIEALRLWGIMHSQGVAEESVGGAKLMLGSQLQLLLSNHDIQSSELASEHAAALITVSCHENTLQPVLATLLAKWSTQLKSLSSPTWSNTKLLSIMLDLVKDSIFSFNTGWIKNTRIIEGIILSSNLLSGQVAAINRDNDSLPTLGVVTQQGQLQPIVSFKSCIPFLSTMVNHLFKYSMFNELKDIVNNQDVIKYLKRLSTSEYSLENSWYTRAELYLLTGLIKASLKINLNELFESSMMMRIAIKLVSTLPSDAPGATKDILRIVLSNESLSIARLSEKLNSLKLIDDQERYSQLPTDISAIYQDFISLGGEWNQPALPRDWPYLPLVASYTRHKKEIKWSERDTMRIVVLLSLEIAMPELFNELSPTLKFSRMILIYLCDTVYLNENVSALLIKVVVNFLTKFYKHLDFENPVPGVSSFTDLFTALCENFCANSYGDDGFAMVLLASIGQRHDKYYRKILWSEHAAALRYIRLTREKLPVPFEEYLTPLEDDPTLIEGYLTALVRRTVREEWSPLMYAIALHHSAMFIKGNGKLAHKMRSTIEGINNEKLKNSLLNYPGTDRYL